jgi:hypothetical protein
MRALRYVEQGFFQTGYLGLHVHFGSALEVLGFAFGF